MRRCGLVRSKNPQMDNNDNNNNENSVNDNQMSRWIRTLFELGGGHTWHIWPMSDIPGNHLTNAGMSWIRSYNLKVCIDTL